MSPTTLPKRVHIVGRKNHGKTTLLCELTEFLTGQGYRVGTIKHTHHQHELDLPGKDSHRHRVAGGSPAGILSRTTSALFWDVDPEEDNDRYAPFAPMFADCDVVLVEGDQMTDAPRIEVWRREVADQPLCATDASIRFVVTNDCPPGDVRTIARDDLKQIAQAVIELAGARPQ